MLIGATCDHHPPVIVPIYPVPGSTIYAGLVEISLVITDNVGVEDAFYRLPGEVQRGLSACPPDTYWMMWDATNVAPNQWYEIDVWAVDDAENRADTTLRFYVVQ